MSEMLKWDEVADVAEVRRAFSSVRSALAGKDGARVLVTSAVPGEGKTTMAAAFAATAVNTYERVLIIDMNWHAPRLHDCFGVEKTLDVNTFAALRKLEGFVLPTGIEGLEILTAPSGSSDLGGGQQMALASRILELAHLSHDLVIIDSQAAFPTNRYIDPTGLGLHAEGTVMVVSGGSTPRQVVKRSCMQIEAGGAILLGVIANWFSGDNGQGAA